MLEIGRQQQSDGFGQATVVGWLRVLGKGLGIGQREWRGLSEGHEIRVLTRGPLSARLDVDGRCLDRRSPLISATTGLPFMSAQVPGVRTGVMIVQVFSKGPFGRGIHVRVAGKNVTMVRTRTD